MIDMPAPMKLTADRNCPTTGGISTSTGLGSCTRECKKSIVCISHHHYNTYQEDSKVSEVSTFTHNNSVIFFCNLTIL